MFDLDIVYLVLHGVTLCWIAKQVLERRAYERHLESKEENVEQFDYHDDTDTFVSRKDGKLWINEETGQPMRWKDVQNLGKKDGKNG